MVKKSLSSVVIPLHLVILIYVLNVRKFMLEEIGSVKLWKMESLGMSLNRYHVTLNYFGEIHTFYTHAKCVDGALKNSVSRLAKLVGRSRSSVLCYFIDGKHDNWKVLRR